ncbi:MAG TPA: ATP-binding protein, partial [Gammaproteobacteria bacterium]|nr:ATP-binding protein [Gammaproteobacteria bacterium]
RKEEEKNYLILHCAGEGIFGIDAQNKITFVNPAAENMLGWKYREVHGQPFQGILQPATLDGTKLAIEDSPIYKTYQDGIVREVNNERFIRKSGVAFDVEYIARPLRDLHGALRGVVVTFKDITRRRELEKTLAKTNQELVTLSRYAGISEVSSGVLHNLGNILNNVNTSFHWIKEKLIELKIKKIILALEQLKNSKVDTNKRKQFQEYIHSALLADQKIIADSIQESKIVEDLITHAKNVLHTQQNFTKKITYKEEVSVEQLIQEAVALSYLGSDLRITYLIKDNPFVLVDKHKAIQILINLIKNAYNAMKEYSDQKPELLFQCEKRNGRIRIKIQDRGPGIPPEVAPNLFAFGVTSRKEGHGFGLHNSANLATEMQGRLFLESSTPAGTCFVLEIPF